MINVSPHYIYEIERGIKSMSLETLVNMSTVLKISTDYIIFGEQSEDTIPLSEQINRLNAEQRVRAECAFKVLLPYIK